MKYEVIDNFLDEEYFDKLVTLFTDKEKKGNMIMPWFFQSSISNRGVIENKLFYMTHVFYSNSVPKSEFFNSIQARGLDLLVKKFETHNRSEPLSVNTADAFKEAYNQLNNMTENNN